MEATAGAGFPLQTNFLSILVVLMGDKCKKNIHYIFIFFILKIGPLQPRNGIDYNAILMVKF